MNLKDVSEKFADICFSAAIAVFPLFGKNNKDKSDEIAVNEMRDRLSELPFGIRVILGEGEKDNAPMLFEGEELGKGITVYDIAVDPLECTTNFAKGLPNSMSLIAFSEKGGITPVPGTYMEQWVAGPKMRSPFDLRKSVSYNINLLSKNLEKEKEDLRIVVQERTRHTDLVEELRALGCAISLIDSGSVTAVLDICLGIGHYDALIGTYGAPEGLISAVIAKCTGSEMKSILRPHEEKYVLKWKASGYTESQVLDKDELITGENIGFSAACISSNIILKGIHRTDSKLSGETIQLLPNNIKKVSVREVPCES